MIKLLTWDTKFFSFKVAQILTKNLKSFFSSNKVELMRKKNIRLIQFVCNINDEKNLYEAQKNNFKYVDLRIQYKKFLKPNNINSKYLVSKARKKDILVLKKNFAHRFNFTRYYTDSNFDKKKILDFYKNWIERSVKGQFDNYTLIMKKNKKILGFCTITEKNSSTAIIGLISTIKNTNGYGSVLIKLVENYLVTRGIKKFYVVTQGRNHQAQKLYDKNFYKIDKVECYYHLWLSNLKF